MTEDKQNVLEGCHCAELGGGYFGRDKTLSKIAERFYWRGMVDDVKEFCKMCDKCQRANRYIIYVLMLFLYMSYIFVLSLCRKFDKTSAELHPMPLKGEVWHTRCRFDWSFTRNTTKK